MQSVISSLIEIIDARIKKALRNMNVSNEILATVKKAENAKGTATVIIGDNDTDISIYNKSGEMLAAGDVVTVTYKSNLAQGYISQKTGAYRGCNISITQSEFDQLEADGKLVEGQTYNIIG